MALQHASIALRCGCVANRCRNFPGQPFSSAALALILCACFQETSRSGARTMSKTKIEDSALAQRNVTTPFCAMDAPELPCSKGTQVRARPPNVHFDHPPVMRCL